MSGKGEFFAIGKSEWGAACDLGLNPAVMLLVMARGTGRDNMTTMWSAEAGFKHTGLAWRRGNEAIAKLCEAGLVIKQKDGKRPRYKLSKPDDSNSLIWLPNTLVTGAAQETPPLAKLRASQEKDHLRAFIELYGDHDLAGDGGLPRKLFYTPYEVRERICGFGPFEVMGFANRARTSFCRKYGALERLWDTKTGTESAAWKFLGAIEGMGLVERLTYLAESEDAESELLHPLDGDEHADKVCTAASTWASDLPGGFKYQVDEYDFVLPVPKHMAKAAIVGIMRLRYRPKTSRTAAWYAFKGYQSSLSVDIKGYQRDYTPAHCVRAHHEKRNGHDCSRNLSGNYEGPIRHLGTILLEGLPATTFSSSFRFCKQRPRPGCRPKTALSKNT
ncbi:MAG: hypothetical protein EOP84_19525 [Verrucomicrobiaceae bacterium]|nr:MAG: hypothetical protein EOP84_19525 [Verrucomicrobiaceae bacterium]